MSRPMKATDPPTIQEARAFAMNEITRTAEFEPHENAGFTVDLRFSKLCSQVWV